MGCKPGKNAVVSPLPPDRNQQELVRFEKADVELPTVELGSTNGIASQTQTEHTNQRSPMSPKKQKVSTYTSLNDPGMTRTISVRSASANSIGSHARQNHLAKTHLGLSDKRTINHGIFNRSKSTSPTVPLLSREVTDPMILESSTEDAEDFLNESQQSHEPTLNPDNASSSSSIGIEKAELRKDTLERYFSATPHHLQTGRKSRMDDISMDSDESFPTLNSISSSTSSMKGDEPSIPAVSEVRSTHSDTDEPKPRQTSFRREAVGKSIDVPIYSNDGRRSLSNELERRKPRGTPTVKFVSPTWNKSDSTQPSNEDEALIPTN